MALNLPQAAAAAGFADRFSENFFKSTIAKEQLQQRREALATEKKITDLKFKQLENQMDPSRLALEKKIKTAEFDKLEAETDKLLAMTQESQSKNALNLAISKNIQSAMGGAPGAPGPGNLALDKVSMGGVTFRNPNVSIIDPQTGELKTVTAPSGKIFRGDSEAQFKLRKESEERRNLSTKINIMDSLGTTIAPQERNVFETSTGSSLDDLQEAYGLERKKDGSVYIPNKFARNQIEQRKTIPTKEIEYLSDLNESSDIMQEVLEDIKNLGIDIQGMKELGQAIPRGYFEGLGPFSLKARFDTIANLSDPKFGALKDKLDRAFQKYRKVITGAQASDKELKTIRPLIANLLQAPERFYDNATELINENKRAYNRRLDLMEGIGRDVSKLRGLENLKQQRGAAQAPSMDINKIFEQAEAGDPEAYKQLKQLQTEGKI